MDEIIGQTVIKDPKGLMNTEFKCPECGSKFFGTVDTRKGRMIRKCKGYYKHEYREYSGCSFRWKEQDDNKYFHKKEL